MSMSTFLKSQKAFLLALDSLRQISADLNKAKDVLALIQEIDNDNHNHNHNHNHKNNNYNNNNNNNNNSNSNSNSNDDDHDICSSY